MFVCGDRRMGKSVEVQGTEISIMTHDDKDFISLTDMLKAKDGDFFISDWLRNRNTVEFLGVWEQIHNPNFNYGEFAIIRSNAGLNSYKISVKEWTEKTNAIGIFAKAGRYGGTYAYKDIAFEFGMWISPEFKIYLIKEFERLKEKEQEKLGWNAKRELAKVNYRIHTDAIKENLIPKESTSQQTSIIYASEADVLNVALLGMTAKQWRENNPDLKGNIRDYASINELIILGGMGFSVILDVLHARRWGRLTLHSRIVLLMTGILILFGMLMTCLLEWNNPKTLDNGLSPAEKVMAAGFQSVTLRTAGFDTIGQGDLTPAGQMVSIILMFIGASPASTGGGIKTTTFFIVLLSVVVMIRRKEDYNIHRRRLNLSLVRRAQAIVFLALGLVLVDTVVISAIESMTGGTEVLADILYEVVSAFGTVGLSTGITPSLNVFSKILIILTMFIGRVGPLTVSMALAGGMRKPDAVRYPEERIMVG